jgi:hypothetical protein
MYPALLDADSPDLGRGSASGLSYALVGNKSLALYYVVGRAYIFRLPVAWVSSDTASTPTDVQHSPHSTANRHAYLYTLHINCPPPSTRIGFV